MPLWRSRDRPHHCPAPAAAAASGAALPPRLRRRPRRWLLLLTAGAARGAEAAPSLEWRRERQEGKALPEVAVCATGQLRFADLTADSFREAVLQALSPDLFAFVVGGRGSLGLLHAVVPDGVPVNFSAAIGPPWRRTAEGRVEWRAAEPLLQAAVAGRIDNRDDLLAELRASGEAWESQIRFPGPWLGGLEEVHAGQRTSRLGSGLFLLRMQKWCRERILEREEAAGQRYRWLVHLRWDQEFLVPLPPPWVLDELAPHAVWAPGFAASPTGTYDRFGMYPRSALEAYLGGWDLLVSGRAEAVLEPHKPAVGEPLLHAFDVTTPELFLQLRLRHAKVEERTLPMLSFVRCRSGYIERSRGWSYCSTLRGMEFDWKEPADRSAPLWLRKVGGAKYPLEFGAAFGTWNCWLQAGANWTVESFIRCHRVAAAYDANIMHNKGLCFTEEERQTWSFQCTSVAEKYVGYGMKSQAVEVLKAAVRDRPLCISHWVRLAAALLSRPVQRHAEGMAALRQIQHLSPGQSILKMAAMVNTSEVEPASLEELLAPSADVIPAPPISIPGSGLDHVLYRRRLQQAMRERGPETEAGRKAWTQWAAYMVEIWWVTAAAVAAEHLEAVVGKEVGERPWLQARAAVIELLEVPPWQASLWNVGITYPRLLQWAPSVDTMLTPAWLARMEKRGCYYDMEGTVPGPTFHQLSDGTLMLSELF